MRHLNDKKESTIQIINQSKNVLTLKCKSLNQTFKSQVKKKHFLLKETNGKDVLMTVMKSFI